MGWLASASGAGLAKHQHSCALDRVDRVACLARVHARRRAGEGVRARMRRVARTLSTLSTLSKKKEGEEKQRLGAVSQLDKESIT